MEDLCSSGSTAGTENTGQSTDLADKNKYMFIRNQGQKDLQMLIMLKERGQRSVVENPPNVTRPKDAAGPCCRGCSRRDCRMGGNGSEIRGRSKARYLVKKFFPHSLTYDLPEFLF